MILKPEPSTIPTAPCCSSMCPTDHGTEVTERAVAPSQQGITPAATMQALSGGIRGAFPCPDANFGPLDWDCFLKWEATRRGGGRRQPYNIESIDA